MMTNRITKEQQAVIDRWAKINVIIRQDDDDLWQWVKTDANDGVSDTPSSGFLSFEDCISDLEEDLGSLREPLPEGFRLQKDADGDWRLYVPDHIVVYSMPGEGILIGNTSAPMAVEEARAIIASKRVQDQIKVVSNEPDIRQVYKATVELFLYVENFDEATDALSASLGDLLMSFNPDSCIVDWRYIAVDGQRIYPVLATEKEIRELEYDVHGNINEGP